MAFRSRRKNKLYQLEKQSTISPAFKSGLEEKVAKQISDAGVLARYEALKIPYVRSSVYNPDFLLSNGIIIETKGFFESSDRAKMRLVKMQHPDLDIRFVFWNAQARIAKKSKTTYAKWAETQGFPWANRLVPDAWLTETASPSRLQAIASLTS